MNITDLRYNVTERYRSGCTDPRGIYGSLEASTPYVPFTAPVSLQVMESILGMDNATARGLWKLRFKSAPTEHELCKDEFYYGLASVWWRDGTLIRHQNVHSAVDVYWPKCEEDAWLYPPT